MNSYEEKQERRRARLEAAAERAEARASAAYRKADLREEVSGIPFGQPVLIGHHSERRHRRAIEKADAAMRRSIEEDKLAKDLRGRAAGVGTGGISSDDPEAVDKIRAEVAKAEAAQAFMREANKVIRKAAKAGTASDSDGFAAYAASLRALPGGEAVTDAAAAELLKPDFCGRIGFADYALTNNGANIRRMQKRLAQLEAAAERETVETSYQGICRVVENAEENRLQIIFDDKPDAEARRTLKAHGFRWAPSAGAWQRHLNNSAKYAAERVLAALTGEAK